MTSNAGEVASYSLRGRVETFSRQLHFHYEAYCVCVCVFVCRSMQNPLRAVRWPKRWLESDLAGKQANERKSGWLTGWQGTKSALEQNEDPEETSEPPVPSSARLSCYVTPREHHTPFLRDTHLTRIRSTNGMETEAWRNTITFSVSAHDDLCGVQRNGIGTGSRSEIR